MAKEDGLNIMIGGDMNAHNIIWELDKYENKNRKLLMSVSVMDEINLQILNCMGWYEGPYMVF